MTNSIVIQVAKSPQGMMIDLYQAPNMPMNPVGMQLLRCSPNELPAWDVGQGVQQRGEHVLQALLDSHTDVKRALLAQLDDARPAHCPIKFWLRHFGQMEQICWETLWRNSFLALSRRWPIARIAGIEPSAAIDLSSHPVDKKHPLRMLAVISAKGVKGEEQWNGLYKAVQNARSQDFPIRLTILTGERALSNLIFSKTKSDLNLCVNSIPNRTIALEKVLESEMPHVIHFFCHGSTTFSTPRLEIATFGSFDGDNPDEKDLSVSLDQLENLESIRNAWLITLNCCRGGAATNDIASLTYSLVAAGVSAALGMTEELEVIDAHEFCKEFYPEVFSTIEKAVKEARVKGVAKLEWLDALYAPRMAIRDKHPRGPENERQWALPVLYMQLQPIQLHAPGKHDETGSMKEEQPIADLMRLLNPEQAERLRQELQKMDEEEKGT